MGMEILEWDTQNEMETQTYKVGHNAQLVQGWLSVEQHDITINQVPLHNISKLIWRGAGRGEE